MQDALSITGVSVVSGAISTLGASIPMLFATITFFTKFGIFMLLTIFLSLTCVPKQRTETRPRGGGGGRSFVVGAGGGARVSSVS